MPAKLKIDTVRLIKRYGAVGYSPTDLARRFRVSTSCIKNVLSGKTHANVVDDPSLPLLSEVTPPPEPDRRRKSPSPSPSPTPAGPTPLGSRPGDIRRVPEPAPKTWETSAAGVYHTGTEALDVQPDPVDVDVQPEPEPEPIDPESWGAKPYDPRRRGRPALRAYPPPLPAPSRYYWAFSSGWGGELQSGGAARVEGAADYPIRAVPAVLDGVFSWTGVSLTVRPRKTALGPPWAATGGPPAAHQASPGSAHELRGRVS